MSGSSGSSGEREQRHRGRNVRGRIGNLRLHQFLPPIEPVLAAVPAPPVAPPPEPELQLFPPVAPPPEPELHLFPPVAPPPEPELQLFPPVAPPPEPELQLFPPVPVAPAAAQELDLFPAAPAPEPEPDIVVPPPPIQPELPPPALAPQVLDAPVGDILVPPPPPIQPEPGFLPNPPAVYLDIHGFPEFPMDDNEGYRHMFKKRLSQFDIVNEINVTGQNLLFFCEDVVQNVDLIDNRCVVRLSVLLQGGVVLDGHANLRVGNLNNTAHLAWRPVLAEHVVLVHQRVFAWYKRMELNGTLHIVIQVQP